MNNERALLFIFIMFGTTIIFSFYFLLAKLENDKINCVGTNVIITTLGKYQNYYCTKKENIKVDGYSIEFFDYSSKQVKKFTSNWKVEDGK